MAQLLAMANRRPTLLVQSLAIVFGGSPVAGLDLSTLADEDRHDPLRVVVVVIGPLCCSARARLDNLGVGLVSCQHQNQQHVLGMGPIDHANFLGVGGWAIDVYCDFHLHLVARGVQHLAAPNVQHPQSLQSQCLILQLSLLRNFTNGD